MSKSRDEVSQELVDLGYIYGVLTTCLGANREVVESGMVELESPGAIEFSISGRRYVVEVNPVNEENTDEPGT